MQSRERAASGAAGEREATGTERMPSSSAGGSENFFVSCVFPGCGTPCGWACCCCLRGTAASGPGPVAETPSGGSVPDPVGWPTPETGAAGGPCRQGRGTAGRPWGACRRTPVGSLCVLWEGARWRRGAASVSLGRGWRVAGGSGRRVCAWPLVTETPGVWREGEARRRAGAASAAARGRGCSGAGWPGSSGEGTGSVCGEERGTCVWEGERVTGVVWGEKGSGGACLEKDSSFSWARRLCGAAGGRRARDSFVCGCRRSWPAVLGPVDAWRLHPLKKTRTPSPLKTTADSACDTDVAAAQNRPWPPSLYHPRIQRGRIAWLWGLGRGTCSFLRAFFLNWGMLSCHDHVCHGGRASVCSCPGSLLHDRVRGRAVLASERGCRRMARSDGAVCVAGRQRAVWLASCGATEMRRKSCLRKTRRESAACGREICCVCVWGQEGGAWEGFCGGGTCACGDWTSCVGSRTWSATCVFCGIESVIVSDGVAGPSCRPSPVREASPWASPPPWPPRATRGALGRAPSPPLQSLGSPALSSP